MIQYSWYNVKKPSFFDDITPWIEESISLLFSQIEHVHYIFCDDSYILTLNQEQLNHDYFTDIITFDLRDDLTQALETEIYISLDTVRDNSHLFNVNYQEELMRVIVHGLLHLTGLNDATEEEKKIMRSEEEKLISRHNSSTWNKTNDKR